MVSGPPPNAKNLTTSIFEAIFDANVLIVCDLQWKQERYENKLKEYQNGNSNSNVAPQEPPKEMVYCAALVPETCIDQFGGFAGVKMLAVNPREFWNFIELFQ